MSGREAVKENDKLLREIVRSIDKEIAYTLKEGGEVQESRFALQLSLRGKEATVSLLIEDLKSAASDAVRKNAVRQKIKSTRDHMLDSHNPDIMGKKIARMLKQSGSGEEQARQRPIFSRSPGRPTGRR